MAAASVKRKGNAADEPAARNPKKRVKVSETEKSDRKKKAGGSANARDNGQPDEAKRGASTAPKASTLTALREEEPAFPRGGGSVLTPLEQKQIQLEAKRDVLFEQKGRGGDAGGMDLDESDDAANDQPTEKAAVKMKKTKTKAKKQQPISAPPKEQGVRIEGLNYKRIAPGSKILGQVTSINAHDIGLALPNNLTGYVPLTAVSETLEKKIASIMEEDLDQEDKEESDEEDGVFEPKSYFHLGQYLRATVSSTQDEKGKKHIMLSVDPRQTNSGLSKSDLVVNATVQASVLSVEDHGLIMGLGIENSDIRGFMAKKEIPPELDMSKIKEGAVFLCMITGHNPSGSVVKLSANLQAAGSIKKSHYLTTAPTINSFLPGTAVEVLLTDVTPTGMAGKIMGMLDAVVDMVHSGASSGDTDLTTKYHVGAKIKGRLTCTLPMADSPKLGFSILNHVLKFSPTNLESGPASQDTPSISAIVPEVKVTKVEPGLGLYVQFGEQKHDGFVHVSRVADGTVESISAIEGQFKVGSSHEARIVGFSAFDNLYLLSFERKVIEQPFLRLEDVTVGTVVKGTIEKLLVGPDGIDGLIVSLADGIAGLVPSMHMSDTKLQHPEKKFREGMRVSARILSVNLERHQLRLTLKKALLNSESAIWKDYDDIAPGNQSPGTLVSIQPHGAIVQFYGSIRGFLPVSEMSEAYIPDPSQHFTVGQVVNVHALTVDAEQRRLVVSCKDPSTFTESYKGAFEKVQPGSLVSGTVFEKSADDILLKLEDTGLIARLDSAHFGDGSLSKNSSNLSRIRVGQKLHDLLILNIQKAHRLIRVSNKPSLKQALEKGQLPAIFEDIQEGSAVAGIVKNVTDVGIFVEFLGGLTGLLPKRLVDEEHLSRPDFGYMQSQTITSWVYSVEHAKTRFTLTMKPTETPSKKQSARSTKDASLGSLNPVDEDIKSMDDLTFGRVTKAKVNSIKDTQLNVQIADNIQGRIDVSEVFDDWNDIKDRKKPLRFFHQKQVLPVRILGIHDARSHKFLPISHRSAKFPVFELTAKPSSIAAEPFSPLGLEDVKVGSSWIGFVNNIAEDCVWINISPNVRGRVRLTDLSDDLAVLENIQKNFPVGSALQVTVTAVDVARGCLDLTAKRGNPPSQMTITDFSKGMILLGRVTKVTERHVVVQLSDTIAGVIELIDMGDDYSKVDPTKFHKNEVHRVCVVDVDVPNKKVSLSVRPSKVLSSSLEVVDPEITSVAQLKINDVVRGFVRRVADPGLFVTLGHNVTGYVKIRDLSDSYLKEWKNEFQVDQLVKGKIIGLDREENKIQMSLKESVLDMDYKAPLTIKDLKPGQIVTGRVRSVEEFGAFILIDGGYNLSGLCHRSEMAEKRVPDARKLYEKDDVVKAKVLKVDLENNKISLGLKASYFKDDEESSDKEGDVEDDSDEGGIDLDLLAGSGSDSEDGDVSMGGVELDNEIAKKLAQDSDEEDDDVSMAGGDDSTSGGGLVTSGFDWTGNATGAAEDDNALSSDSDEGETTKKKRRRKPEIKVDRTGELDANGPQSVADYERLLLGEPDSSLLWLKYMAFQLELGEVDKARGIAERALRSISIGQDTEKLNIWVALLNLENTFGNDETLEETFKRACQYNDAQEIHERLVSIYIQSEKTEKADELFQTILKKKYTKTPELFLNYANFLFDTLNEPERGRALLPRAIQSLPPHTHVETTSKFGQLEFRSPNGDIERGRTVFEGLLSSFPKRVDIWNVLLDLEIKVGDVEQVRRLFKRALGIGQGAVAHDGTKVTGKMKLKDKQAKFLFKKWLAFEEKSGDEKMVDEVKARAAEYVKALKEGE